MFCIKVCCLIFEVESSNKKCWIILLISFMALGGVSTTLGSYISGASASEY